VALYTLEIGSYAFALAPETAISAERVVRANTAPNEAVAVNYTFSLRPRLRADTPAAVMTALTTALSSWQDTRTCGRFRLKDEAGAVISPFDVDEERSPTLNWEDVRVESFDLPAGDGQLVAGATFSVVIRARRSLPDSDGICEFDANYEQDADEFGNEVRRLTVSFRFAKASVIDDPADYTTAIRARLRLAAPVGYVRTAGDATLGFSYRHPLYPLCHVVQTVSEVRTVSGGGGTSVPAPEGAVSARTTVRRVVDPERGIVRVTESAEVSGGETPEAWVREQRPSAAIVSEAITAELGSTANARGEWTRIEAFRSFDGKTVDVTRTYAHSGGTRDIGVTRMTPPYRPHFGLGPFSHHALTETIEVRAKGASALTDFALPAPLPAPFKLGAVARALPRVEESAVDPEERLWLLVVTREYVWDDTTDPLANQALIAAMFADGTEEGGAA
jgi:hypothetical protein